MPKPLASENITVNEMDAIAEKFSTKLAEKLSQNVSTDAFCMKITIKEDGIPQRLVTTYQGIFESVTILALTSNSNTVLVGGSNPLFPLSAGNSTILRKKDLRTIYISGTSGDGVIILA